MRAFSLFSFLTCALLSPPALADTGEFQRLRVDLEGDGRAVIVSLSTSPAQKDWRRVLTVAIPGTRYRTEYFSADGDLPSARVVILDRARHERQLLIETIEAGSCVYHLLAYKSKKLVSIFRFDSTMCRAPEIWGNGKFGVPYWEGFWTKIDTYRIAKAGTAAAQEIQEQFLVGVAGIAGERLQLADAGCASNDIAAGTLLHVAMFNSQRAAYLLRAGAGTCGWIPESEVNTITNKILELPWAG